MLIRTSRTARCTRLAVVGAACLAVVVGALVPTTPAYAAASAANFDPGYIISDAIFYDSTTMSASDIQVFLDQKGAGCQAGSDGTPCLKDFRQDTQSRAATSRCPGGYAGAPAENAATIIAKVAQSCGVNPQVLLVTLQKEQGLVLGSGSGLYASRYRSAMGYGCPDTAACDSTYYGFFNQVYSAASQFRNYALNPTWYSHRAGITQDIAYSPNAACGSSPVLIQNQATAGLYNYTPYQPNAASLAAGYGSAGTCGSYGNRNFYLYFTDWFGPTTQRAPIGVIDSITTSTSSVTVNGWAFDPDTTDPILVHVYVDGRDVAASLTTISRPDVAAIYKKGDLHGYSITAAASAGSHRICAYAVDSAGGSSPEIGCQVVTVVNHPPVGVIDSATGTGIGQLTVTGWAFDPDTTDATLVHVYVDGRDVAAGPTTIDRPDVAAIYGTGPQHGYSITVGATAGSHWVCAYAVDATGGSSPQIGCRTVTVVNHPPVGVIDSATATGIGQLTVTGWAFDPDTTDATLVHVYVDGRDVAAGPTTIDRPDVAAIYGTGPQHGYSITAGATGGDHRVCAYAVDATGGSSPEIGCRTVTVVNHSPVGVIDSATVAAGQLTVSGWAFDPDTTAPIGVTLLIDGAVAGSTTAASSRPDVAAVYGDGDRHGYTTTVPTTPGAHTVCLVGIDSAAGIGSQITCAHYTAPSPGALPVGVVDSTKVTGTTATASGWAFDPDTTAPIDVRAYVDGNRVASMTAADSRPDVGTVYGKGDLHGYTLAFGVPSGAHTACLRAVDANAGIEVPIGCTNVTVAAGAVNRPPVGVIDQVTATNGRLTVIGWAFDPDTTAPIGVTFLIDGAVAGSTTAANSRPDVAAVYGDGDRHGYTTTVPTTPGTHTVCIVGIDPVGGPNPQLACTGYTTG